MFEAKLKLVWLAADDCLEVDQLEMALCPKTTKWKRKRNEINDDANHRRATRAAEETRSALPIFDLDRDDADRVSASPLSWLFAEL